MSEIEIYDFKGNEVRCKLIDGEPWFCLLDVGRALGIDHTGNMSQSLDDDEKTFVQVNPSVCSNEDGRDQGVPPQRPLVFITEPAAYQVVMTSRKPQAKLFQRWLARKAVDLRKHGIATMDGDSEVARRMSENPVYLLLRKQTQMEIRQELTEKRVRALEANFGPSDDPYLTVMGYCRNNDLCLPPGEMNNLGRRASAYCRRHDIPIEKITDTRYGFVGAYPASVLDQVIDRY